MKNIYLIQDKNISLKFRDIIQYSTRDYSPELVTSSMNLPNLQGKKIIIAMELDRCGFNTSLFEILLKLNKRGEKALLDSKAVIILQSPSELFTKSMARKIIFLCNQMGCAFPGHPVVEAIENFINFHTWQKIYNRSLLEIYKIKCKELVDRLIMEKMVKNEKPKILVLHSSDLRTSNTMMLWKMVKKNMKSENIKELHVENGTIIDCRGCSYKTCIHYSKDKSCFYGGIMVEEILPAIEDADCIVWLCPNYNDALSAKLMAVVNRMTVLYKRVNFRNKTIFSIIVSGNSGSDCVAEQLIGALNINKGFILPPYFSLKAIANNPGSVTNVSGINTEASKFSQRIIKSIKKI